jgi:hypothetical protein
MEPPNLYPCLEHVDKLARIETKIDGISARLDRLNGSVARHEKDIGDLKAFRAVQEVEGEAIAKIANEDSQKHVGLDTRVAVLEETSNKAKGAKAVIVVVAAFIFSIVGSMLGPIGEHIISSLHK